MDERQRLTTFITHVVDYLRRECSDGSLDATANSLKESLSHRVPISGLRQAAGDMVEWCQDLSPTSVSRLDAILATANGPTLSQMRNRQFRQLQGVLAQDKLKSAAQYQLLESALADTADSKLSESDRTRANRLLAAYHAR